MCFPPIPPELTHASTLREPVPPRTPDPTSTFPPCSSLRPHVYNLVFSPTGCAPFPSPTPPRSKTCIDLSPTRLPVFLPSPAPVFPPSPRPTPHPTKPPTHEPTPKPSPWPSFLPSPVPTYGPTTYPTPACAESLALLRVDTKALNGGTGWGALNFSVFACPNNTGIACARDTALFGGTLASGSTGDVHYACVGNSSCFAFVLEGSKPAHSVSWEIKDASLVTPTLRGTEDSDEALFCLANGAFNLLPSSQPTTSLAPVPAPTPLPSNLPTPAPSHAPSPKPSEQPTPVPSPEPTRVPTPLPTIQCDPGYFVNRAIQCEACAVGRYSNATLPPFPKWECPLCPSGQVSKVTAARECQLCASGKFSSAERDSCGACGAGEYVLNASSCENCPLGYYAPVALNDKCFLCSSGSATGVWSGAYLCSDCSGGQYAPSASMNCSLCEAGQYSGTRSGECSNCSVGSYVSDAGSSVCYDCIAGKNARLPGAAQCADCKRGYQSGSRAQYCKACSVGTYASRAGSEYCDSCVVGKVAPAAGSSSCQNCTAGRNQPAYGQSACTGCEKGRYAEEPGASVCVSCSVGKVAPATNTSLCDDCAAGQYQSAVAQTACVACREGFYAPEKGLSTCSDCPGETYFIFFIFYDRRERTYPFSSRPANLSFFPNRLSLFRVSLFFRWVAQVLALQNKVLHPERSERHLRSLPRRDRLQSQRQELTDSPSAEARLLEGQFKQP